MPEQRPTAATKHRGLVPDDLLVAARRVAAARYESARPQMRQALTLAATYVDDGAPISAYLTLLRACEAVVRHETEAGPGPWTQFPGRGGDVR